jgi:hypothetical protein
MYLMRPYVTTVCLAFLFYIQEVSGSSLGPETGYPGWGFSWFSSVSPGKFWDSTLNLVSTASCRILSNSLFINYLNIQRYRVWATDSIVK